MHDYMHRNATTDQWDIYNAAITTPNSYNVVPLSVFAFSFWANVVDVMPTLLVLHRGSVVQQAVSVLAILPDYMLQGSGQQFHAIGFEHNLPMRIC